MKIRLESALCSFSFISLLEDFLSLGFKFFFFYYALLIQIFECTVLSWYTLRCSIQALFVCVDVDIVTKCAGILVLLVDKLFRSISIKQYWCWQTICFINLSTDLRSRFRPGLSMRNSSTLELQLLSYYSRTFINLRLKRTIFDRHSLLHLLFLGLLRRMASIALILNRILYRHLNTL